MPRVGLQCVIVVFPDHTYLLFLFCCRLLKTHTHIHCIYMYFAPDCKLILKKLEGMLYFINQRANKHEWHNT